MLKTTGLSKVLAPKAFRADNNKVVRSGSGRADETIVDLSKSKKLKITKFKIQPGIEAKRESIFLTFSSKKPFDCLSQAFVEALILLYLDKTSINTPVSVRIYALTYYILEFWIVYSKSSCRPSCNKGFW